MSTSFPAGRAGPGPELPRNRRKVPSMTRRAIMPRPTAMGSSTSSAAAIVGTAPREPRDSTMSNHASQTSSVAVTIAAPAKI